MWKSAHQNLGTYMNLLSPCLKQSKNSATYICHRSMLIKCSSTNLLSASYHFVLVCVVWFTSCIVTFMENAQCNRQIQICNSDTHWHTAVFVSYCYGVSWTGFPLLSTYILLSNKFTNAVSFWTLLWGWESHTHTGEYNVALSIYLLRFLVEDGKWMIEGIPKI